METPTDPLFALPPPPPPPPSHRRHGSRCQLGPPREDRCQRVRRQPPTRSALARPQGSRRLPPPAPRQARPLKTLRRGLWLQTVRRGLWLQRVWRGLRLQAAVCVRSIPSGEWCVRLTHRPPSAATTGARHRCPLPSQPLPSGALQQPSTPQTVHSAPVASAPIAHFRKMGLLVLPYSRAACTRREEAYVRLT